MIASAILNPGNPELACPEGIDGRAWEVYVRVMQDLMPSAVLLPTMGHTGSKLVVRGHENGVIVHFIGRNKREVVVGFSPLGELRVIDVNHESKEAFPVPDITQDDLPSIGRLKRRIQDVWRTWQEDAT